MFASLAENAAFKRPLIQSITYRSSKTRLPIAQAIPDRPAPGDVRRLSTGDVLPPSAVINTTPPSTSSTNPSPSPSNINNPSLSSPLPSLTEDSWPEWLAFFDSLDELAEQGEEIEERLEQAVAAENYSLASQLSAELRELTAQDHVEVASQALQQALETEDYQRAAALRDRAGLGLLGWWAGKSSTTTTTTTTSTDNESTNSDNDHGHLLYVSKDFGRVVGEAFSAKDLASLVEQRSPLDGPDNGASILMSAASSIGSSSLGELEDAFSGFMKQDEQQMEYGRPVFEVFLKSTSSGTDGDGDASIDIQQKVAAIRVHPDTVNQVMPSMVESLAEVITGDLTDNGQKVVSVESGADEDGEFVRINLSSGKTDDDNDNDKNGNGDDEEINVESFLEKFYEEEEAAEKKKNGADREDGIHARRYADVVNTAEEEGELTSFESMQIQFQRVPADIQWQGRDAFTITVDDTAYSLATHEDDESTSSTTAEAAMLAISDINNDDNDDESSSLGTTTTTATTDEFVEKPVQETIEDLKARLVADSDDLTLESLAAEIEAIQAERLKRKEGTSSSKDTDKDDKEIFNKVFTKVMKAAMEDEKLLDRDNGMLFFNSIANGNTLSYSRLLPSQATKTDPLSGLFIGAFGPHGPEIVQVNRTNNKQNGEEWVVATKLTGDVNVPAGKVSFKAKVGRAARLSISEAYPPELGVVARYKGQGMVAKEGYKNAKWVDGELLQLSRSNPLTKGAELGFVFALDGLRRYLILFAKLDLDEIAEMRENNNNLLID